MKVLRFITEAVNVDCHFTDPVLAHGSYLIATERLKAHPTQRGTYELEPAGAKVTVDLGAVVAISLLSPDDPDYVKFEAEMKRLQRRQQSKE